MALRSISQLKSWFRKGMYPTESQFGDWLDSFFHRDDKIPVGSVDGLSEAINSKAEKSAVDTLSQSVSAISTKADSASSAASSALGDAKQALSDAATAQATAQQAIADASAAITALKDGVAIEGDTLAKLYAKIQTLNTIVTSNDVNLDTVQEIVTFIKNNKDVIDSISTNKVNISDIVDNLLSTDINRPLSANQGKVLKDLLDALTTFLGNKVDKVIGKQLSTEDFTTEEKQKLAQQSGVNTGDQDLSGLQARVEKNQANGYAGLDETGKVPAALLPSYVDDVLEFANFAALPAVGESGKIYITTNDNKQYRWSGSVYVNIAASPGTTDSVTEGVTNLYFTEGRVRNAVLTGISFLVNQAITATDSVLGALGKLQAQITGLGTGKIDKSGAGQSLPAGVSSVYDILQKIGIESNADLTSLLSNTSNALFNALASANKDTLIEIIKWLIENKVDRKLSTNTVWVGDVSGVPVEESMIDYVDPNLTNPTQIHPVGFAVRLNTGFEIAYLHNIFRSIPIAVQTAGVTQIYITNAGRKILIKDIYVQVVNKNTGSTPPSNIQLDISANADGSVPFASVSFNPNSAADTVAAMSIPANLINLDNGLYFKTAGWSGYTLQSTVVVIINALYL